MFAATCPRTTNHRQRPTKVACPDPARSPVIHTASTCVLKTTSLRAALAPFVLLALVILVPDIAHAQQAVADAPGRARAASFDALARASLAQIEGELRVPGLEADVEVIRDEWG